MSFVYLMLIIHIISATTALTIGTILFCMKRSKYTRYIGYIWRVSAYVGSISSFLMVSKLSWIHALSIITFVSISVGIAFGRQKNWQSHNRAMLGAYIGMVIAFLFTFYPSRLLGIELFQFLGIHTDMRLTAFYIILIVGMIYPIFLIKEYINLYKVASKMP